MWSLIFTMVFILTGPFLCLGCGCGDYMRHRPYPRVSWLGKRSISDLWLFLPGILGGGTVCPTNWGREGICVLGAIPDLSVSCSLQWEMVWDIGDVSLWLSSSCQLHVWWLARVEVLICCTFPIVLLFLVFSPRYGKTSYIVECGEHILSGIHIPVEILPIATFLCGSLLLPWVVLVLLFWWNTPSGCLLIPWALLWAPSSPPSV